MAACIATWIFGLPAVKSAKIKLLSGDTALNAVEKSVNDVEEDLSSGAYLVGRGGRPNDEGVLECDAAIMDGQGSRFGAVAALQGVSCPIRVARRVMEQSKHNMLVGAGAQAFAVAQGFAIEAHEELLGVESLAKYREYKEKGAKQSGHDTLGLITLDREGHIAVGVTTSGMAFKEPGRVGDSPLPGPGLYVDGRYGAACATGDGDDILKFSPCSRVVMLMGRGLHPQEACAQVVGDIAQVWKSGDNSKMLELGVVAMSVKGAYGAATTLEKWIDIKTGDEYPGFPFAVWHQTEVPEERIDVVKCV